MKKPSKDARCFRSHGGQRVTWYEVEEMNAIDDEEFRIWCQSCRVGDVTEFNGLKITRIR